MKDIEKDNKIKVFVDEPVGNISDDVFGHKHYVNVLKRIIGNCQNEQLNIGLFGKWGVGKTTIINMLESEISKENRYKIVKFDCWKYANEPVSLKRKFLIEVAKQIGESTNELKELLYIKGSRQINNKSILEGNNDLTKSIKEMFKSLFYSSMIIMILNFIAYSVLYKFFYVREEMSISLVFNSVMISIFFHIVKILKDYTSNVTITKANENLESLEQFESTFEKIITKTVKSNKKIIVFVDDLDRCQNRKVVEVLETIKTFMNVKNCIFIIACDNEILKKALNEEKIEDSDYLDKIFQIKMSIPPFRQEGIKKYSLELLSSTQMNIPNAELEKINDVLVYKNVMNPRKVKILLNNFIILFANFRTRLEEGNYFTSNFEIDLVFLAKITVLQTEFTTIYYDLIRYNRLLEYIERVRIGDTDFEEPQRDILSKYYDIDENDVLTFKVKDDYREAIDYLYYTSTCIVSREHIKTYIYLSQDKLNISYSDEYVENLENLIIYKDINGFIAELDKIKSVEEKLEIFDSLLMRINHYENLDIINVLESLSNPEIINMVPKELEYDYAGAILNRMQEYKNSIKQFNVKGIVNSIDITKQYENYSDILDEVVSHLTLDNLDYSFKVLNSICINHNLVFNIDSLDRFLDNLFEKNHSEVINLISRVNNQQALEKYFIGDIFETIMCFEGKYERSQKEIISRYLLKISDKMIDRDHILFVDRILKYINDTNSKMSSACIQALDKILYLDKDIKSYAIDIIEALSLEIIQWDDINKCNKIFELMIEIGTKYSISDENKTKLVTRLCEYYIQDNEVFAKAYTNSITDVVIKFKNIDKVVENIVHVIKSINTTTINKSSNKFLVCYINGVKSQISSAQRNNIIQNILTMINTQSNQVNKSMIEYFYSLLRQCSSIIEPEKTKLLSNILINITNSGQRSSLPVSEEIIKLTYEMYNELMYMFNDNDIKNQYFSSILKRMEDNVIYDFAVKHFNQNYTLLVDNNIRIKILSIIMSRDCTEINNNLQKVIEILKYYGSDIINELIGTIFAFIDKKFKMSEKINNLCLIIEELQYNDKNIELKILSSMYSTFESEIQNNVFSKILFNERTVRDNTITLFIDGEIDNEYLYTLKAVSEKIDNDEERMLYYSLIEDKIKNNSSETEISRFLELFVGLKDEDKYLTVNKTNSIINNTFIHLLQGGLAQKKAGLNILNSYYSESKFPRGMSSNLVEILNNIINNNEEIREEAINVTNSSGLLSKRIKNISELKTSIEKYSEIIDGNN